MTRIRSNSPVSALSQLTEKRPLPGRDSIGREQREIFGLVWEWLAGTGNGACWVETNQSIFRETFPVLFELIRQMVTLDHFLNCHSPFTSI